MSTLRPDPLRGLTATNRHMIYRELRENAPIYWSSVHAAWVLSRYPDVDAALRSPDALALDPIPHLQAIGRRGGLDLANLVSFLSCVSLLTRPPRHDAIRRVLAQALVAVRQMNLAILTEQSAASLLAQGAREGSIDLAAGFAQTITLFVIGSFLGIPDEDIRELGALGLDLSEVFERRMQSVSMLRILNARAASLMNYFALLIANRRQKPGEDGVSLIVRLADEAIGCDDRELAGICTFFFIAAKETTTVGISTAALMLLENGGLRARLTDDPSLVPAAVREFLRLASPLQFIFRQFGADQEIAGQKVRAAEPIMLMLGAANRDPVAFSNPDEPELDREGPESLAFAAGPYRCVGAQLATMELEIAVRSILAYPELRLSSEAPVWSKRMNATPLMRLVAEFA